MSRGIYDKVNKVRIPIAGAQVPNVDDVLLATSENPVQNRIIKSALDNKANSSDIPSKTSELTNDSNFIQDANYKHINVDNALSTTSTNPVQNKVIKSALDNKADNSNVPTKTSDLTNDSNFVADANYTHIDIDSTLSDTSENPVQNKVIKSALDNKLGTNDIAAWAKESTKPTYTASEVGLGNVGNFKAVSTEVNQGLSETEKANARANIGAGNSSFSGSYNDLSNKPTLGTAAAKDVAVSGNASATQVVMGNDTRLTDSRPASDVSSWAKASTKPSYTASEVGAISSTLKGAVNGVAELDSTGRVPSSQLPSYVDDVLEYGTLTDFPSTGETGKIYVAKDTNKTYRWSGTAYVVLTESLALGETSATAYRGDRGKIAYDHSQSTHARIDATKVESSSTNGNIKINGTETTVYTHPGSGTNPHGTTKSDVGLGNVGNFKAVSTEANQGLSDTEKSNARANIGAGTGTITGIKMNGASKGTSGVVDLGTVLTEMIIPINPSTTPTTNGAMWITTT